MIKRLIELVDEGDMIALVGLALLAVSALCAMLAFLAMIAFVATDEPATALISVPVVGAICSAYALKRDHKRK